MDSNSTLGDLAVQVIDHINPGEMPRTLFHHYSLPNFDSGKRPQLESGMSIKSGKLRVADGTVLLSKLNPGSPKVWRIPKAMSQHAIASTEFLVLQPRTGITLNALYAACLNPSFLRLVAAKATGTSSSHQRVRPSDLLATNLDLGVGNAALAEIGDFVAALDDKIELNRRINATLEAMARALFQSWFVDFDPVRAKAEGRQPVGMDAETAALFPDSFEDSALGPIPKGWEAGPVESVCSEITSGGTPARSVASYWAPAEIPWFKTGELHDGPLLKSEEMISRDGLTGSSCKIWPPGTILFALYASPTVGRFGVLTQPGTANQAAAALVAKSEYGIPFLMGSLLSSRDDLQRYAVGAAQQNINQAVLKNHVIVIPPANLAAAYSTCSTEYYVQRVNVLKQSDSLSDLRDALLPKLLSGELRVGDVAA